MVGEEADITSAARLEVTAHLVALEAAAGLVIQHYVLVVQHHHQGKEMQVAQVKTAIFHIWRVVVVELEQLEEMQEVYQEMVVLGYQVA